MPLQYINNYLDKWFHFPKNKIYCQVATSNDTKPHIRTMDLYKITTEGNVIFLTETSTRKWADLNYSPNAAICLLNQERGQIIAEGQVDLKTALIDFSTTEFYWNHCLDEYWRNFYTSRNEKSISGISLSFGIIILQPIFWEILEINQTDFLKSSRKQYHKKGSDWIESEIEPV